MKKKKVIIPLSILIILFGLVSVVSPKFLLNTIGGRISFPNKFIDSKLTMEDGKEYSLFRTLHVDMDNRKPGENAVFIVRFKFKDLSLEANKKLSMIPALFLTGMDGFIEKNWTINSETGEFQGIYQWESIELAERYTESFIYKLMTKRAAPGSLSYDIKPNTDLSQYLKKRISK